MLRLFNFFFVFICVYPPFLPMESNQTRVVLLIDASYKGVENSGELNSLCLACTRVLLCLAEFPNKKNEVTWNYTFLNCIEPIKKAGRFFELRSEFLENLIKDIKYTKLRTQSAARGGQYKPANVVYRALAAVVQDFVWDAPELFSPARYPGALGPRNMIFIFSACPHNPDDLHQFCYGTPRSNHQQSSYKEVLQNELIPNDLLMHLRAKSISVFWIDTMHLSNSRQHPKCTQDCIGTTLMASAMGSSAGQLIPIEGILHRCTASIDSAHPICSVGNDVACGGGGSHTVWFIPVFLPHKGQQHTTSTLGSRLSMFSTVLTLGNYLLPNTSPSGYKAVSQLNEALAASSQNGQRENPLFHEGYPVDLFCGVALTLIKQAELPLNWLDPSRTYLCGSDCSLSITGDLLPVNVLCGQRIPEVHLCGHLHRMHIADLSTNPVGTDQVRFGPAQNDSEDLFIWLARNRTLLLLGIQSPLLNIATSLAILQPLTPSRASLSSINPSFHSHIWQCVSDLYSVGCSSLMENVTKSLKRKSNSPTVLSDHVLYSRSNLPLNLQGSFHFPLQTPSLLVNEAQPFLDLNLISWHTHLPMCGVSHNAMKELLSFQKASSAVETQRASCMEHLNTLQRQLCLNSSSVTSDMDKPIGCPPSVLNAEERKDSESLPICENNVFSGFQHRYQEQLKAHIEMEELKMWVAREISLLSTALLKLGFDISDPAAFFSKLCDNNILLTHSKLHDKYADSIQTCLEGKAIEYQMQVLLLFEVAKLWTNCECEPIASELVHLLRDLSFMKNPGFMGRYMKEIILPSYSLCCQKLLVDVFEGLMLPLPASLCDSGLQLDDNHLTAISTPSTLGPASSATSQEDSQGSCISKQQLQDDSTSLSRRNSFSGFYHQERRISITSKRKKSQTKATENDVCRSEHEDQERSVRRTLFNRSHTISDFGWTKTEATRPSKTCKKGSPTFEKLRDIIVKETPRKKQVENYRKFKLQRHRSKAEGQELPDVLVIGESPKRSFYSTIKSLHHGEDLHTADQLPSVQQSPEHCSSEEILDQASPMHSMDLCVEHETASMMAFALCTPTKDEPSTFSGFL